MSFAVNTTAIVLKSQYLCKIYGHKYSDKVVINGVMQMNILFSLSSIFIVNCKINKLTNKLMKSNNVFKVITNKCRIKYVEMSTE